MSEPDGTTSPWIVDTTAEAFEQDVFERSQQTPVVVDFWAPWCAPCRTLGPVLEKLADAYAGRFILVKANSDELPDAAARFQVQGIPAVFGLICGEVADLFQGVLPEDQIRDWLDRLLSAADLAAAQQLEGSDPAAAEAKYRVLVDQLPRESAVQIGLARTLLAQESIDECQQIIGQLEARGFLEPEAEKIRAALGLYGSRGDDLDQSRAAVEASPDDLDLQLQLAQALAGNQVYEEALQVCLQLVEKDKRGVGDQARQLMIEVFRVLPDDSELISNYRRKLSVLLF